MKTIFYRGIRREKRPLPDGYLFTNRDLTRLIAPLVVEQILAVTVGMVDTMMVSSVGEAATSGVSLVDMINTLLINLFAAVSTGGAVVSSQFLGQKKERKSLRGGKSAYSGYRTDFSGCNGSLDSVPERSFNSALWKYRTRCYGKCVDLSGYMRFLLSVFGCI